MQLPETDSDVQLIVDIPELGLRRGMTGIVCSTWFAPAVAYEVEFEQVDLGSRLRVLLLKHQLSRSEN
jgi:hypothetical protein